MIGPAKVRARREKIVTSAVMRCMLAVCKLFVGILVLFVDEIELEVVLIEQVEVESNFEEVIGVVGEKKVGKSKGGVL